MVGWRLLNECRKRLIFNEISNEVLKFVPRFVPRSPSWYPHFQCPTGSISSQLMYPVARCCTSLALRSICTAAA